MKLRILAVDWPLEHPAIKNHSFKDAPSFADYHAVVIDPAGVSKLWKGVGLGPDGSRRTYMSQDKGLAKDVRRLISQRKAESISLVMDVGGVLVCKLSKLSEDLVVMKRPLAGSNKYHYGNYSWVPSPRQDFAELLHSEEGSIVNVSDKGHPFADYFATFDEVDVRHFSLTVDKTAFDKTALQGCKVLATNRAGRCVALDLPMKSGHLVLLPDFRVPQSQRKKEGTVLFDCIRALLKLPGGEEEPPWLSEFSVPTEHDHDPEIANFDDKIGQFQNKRDSLVKERERKAGFKKLLYETGRGLELVVREAFRELGFDVPGPEDYDEDWDVWLKGPGQTQAIAEIGAVDKGPISVGKYSQLLRYVQDALTTKNTSFKGILIANAYRKIRPEERAPQFTDPVKRGCEPQRYCMLTTNELFKALCALLENAGDEQLKGKIRSGIVSCVGEYKFQD